MFLSVMLFQQIVWVLIINSVFTLEFDIRDFGSGIACLNSISCEMQNLTLCLVGEKTDRNSNPPQPGSTKRSSFFFFLEVL